MKKSHNLLIITAANSDCWESKFQTHNEQLNLFRIILKYGLLVKGRQSAENLENVQTKNLNPVVMKMLKGLKIAYFHTETG